MPKIRRYFPVTHDINSDPEMWELRDNLGDRAGFVWLEMLAIADRNEGRVGPNSGSTLVAVSSKCRTTKAKVSSVLDYAQVKGWINLGADILIAKFWEYHRRREPIKNPHGNGIGSLLPSEPSEPPNLKDTAPPAYLLKKEREKKLVQIQAELKQIVDRRPDLAKVVGRWIEHAVRMKVPHSVIIETLRDCGPKLNDPEGCYKYLEVAAGKKLAVFNARTSEAESARHKAEDRKYLGVSSAGNRLAANGR
jgi:hypothetical protein